MRLTIALLALALAACSKPAPQAPAAPANSAAAESDLAGYRQLVAAGSNEIAVTMGREILRKYPGTPAAKEVEASLAKVQQAAQDTADAKRMAALWSYQSSTASDGKPQESASIYSSEPGGESERVRLILRRHPAWGQSVYVFSYGKGFKCGNACTVGLKFGDGPYEKWAAFAPETGEPAIFIKDDVKFLERLPGAKRLEINATHLDRGAMQLVFETGGYDAKQFKQLLK
ncbi:MAG TPA: hypothetical protein VFL14_10710 [Xanthomonadales bacterium]|nr:hypothetical protein [Xanthomonadales bacterium]